MTALIDDAGTDPQQAVALATGLIIPANRIVALQDEWDTLTAKEEFSCFHMTEFSCQDRKSEFASWCAKKHERVYRRVREIIKKYGLVTASFTVLKNDYDEVVPPDLRKHSGEYHYSWAVRFLVDYLSQWRLHRNVTHPLEFVFDWMEKNDERRKEIDAVMDQQGLAAAQVGLPREFENYTFRHKEEIPGLQCVDTLAWIAYQYSLLAFCGKPLYPDAKIGWDDFSAFSKQRIDWQISVTLKRSELERWVASPEAVAHTRKWFGEWEEQWKEKNLANMEKRTHGRQRKRKIRQSSSDSPLGIA